MSFNSRAHEEIVAARLAASSHYRSTFTAAATRAKDWAGIVMKFEQYPIDLKILKALLESSFKHPTDIQFRAIPSILAGEDGLGTRKEAVYDVMH